MSTQRYFPKIIEKKKNNPNRKLKLYFCLSCSFLSSTLLLSLFPFCSGNLVIHSFRPSTGNKFCFFPFIWECPNILSIPDHRILGIGCMILGWQFSQPLPSWPLWLLIRSCYLKDFPYQLQVSCFYGHFLIFCCCCLQFLQFNYAMT